MAVQVGKPAPDFETKAYIGGGLCQGRPGSDHGPAAKTDPGWSGCAVGRGASRDCLGATGTAM